MSGTNIYKSSLSGLFLILSERYIGNNELHLDKATITKFIESAGSDALSDFLINNNYIAALKMSSVNSQLLTNSVLSGIIYLLINYFMKTDANSMMYKFLYQVGSSAVANFSYTPLTNAIKMA